MSTIQRMLHKNIGTTNLRPSIENNLMKVYFKQRKLPGNYSMDPFNTYIYVYIYISLYTYIYIYIYIYR